MNISFASPVATTQANPVQQQGFQGVTTVSGQLSPFEILMQQLSMIAATTGEQGQTGMPLSFEMPLLNSTMPTELPFTVSEDGMVDAEQLAALLQQLILPEEQMMELPQIVQELQSALADATALGEDQVALGSMFESMDAGMIQECMQSLQDGSHPQMQSIMSGLEEYLASLEEAGTVLSEDQKAVQDVLKQYFETTASQQNMQQTQMQQLTPEQEQQLAENMNVFKDSVGESSDRPVVMPAAEEQMQQEATVTTPEYLVPDYLAEPGMTFQVESMYQKAGMTPMQQTELPRESALNELQEATELLVDDSLMQDDTSGMQMRNSLNLATDGQSSDAESQKAAVAAETDKPVLHFDEKLQRLQETEAIVRQISKQMSIHQGMQTTELTVQLEPAYLGQVQVSVRNDADGMAAEIIVSNPQVKDLLESDLTALRNAMNDSNVKVEKIDITVDENFEDSVIDMSNRENPMTANEGSENGKQTTGLFGDMLNTAGDSAVEEHAEVSVMDKIHQVNIVA